jgi:hypothetical protein
LKGNQTRPARTKALKLKAFALAGRVGISAKLNNIFLDMAFSTALILEEQPLLNQEIL